MEMKMESSDGSNWRKEADANLKRLHSFLFGSDLAANQRSDPASARILGLLLMGFLDSRNRTPVNAAYIDLIRSEIFSKVDAYACALAPNSDRKVVLLWVVSNLLITSDTLVILVIVEEQQGGDIVEEQQGGSKVCIYMLYDKHVLKSFLL